MDIKGFHSWTPSRDLKNGDGLKRKACEKVAELIIRGLTRLKKQNHKTNPLKMDLDPEMGNSRTWRPPTTII